MQVKTLLIYLVFLAVFLGLGYWLFQSSETTEENLPAGVTVYDIQGAGHMPGCNPGELPYNSNPPTSGCHDPRPADWGIYTTTISDQAIMHSLEHGGIWISYKSDKVDAETVAKLQDFAKRYRKVVVEPRDANDANIAFAAWGRTQKFDQYDETAMIRFIEAYYDKGPEKAG